MDSNGYSIQDAMRFAQSDTGKQLIALLQQTQGETLKEAMAQASSGNLEQTKKTMQSVLSDPKIRAILEQMGGSHG